MLPPHRMAARLPLSVQQHCEPVQASEPPPGLPRQGTATSLVLYLLVYATWIPPNRNSVATRLGKTQSSPERTVKADYNIGKYRCKRTCAAKARMFPIRYGRSKGAKLSSERSKT